ncbi:MAG: AAA family ATPase [Planctomycetes bacterium]|nr:AAA family ATPase [Planctomycetota bacterium]
MIRSFQVQNYKALRDVKLNLTPIHLLIGPNDSGKTSILEAMEALCRSVDYTFDQAFMGLWEGSDLVWQRQKHAGVRFRVHADNGTSAVTYELACKFTPGRRAGSFVEEIIAQPRGVEFDTYEHPLSWVGRAARGEYDPGEEKRCIPELVHEVLSGVQLYRLDPRFLSLPVALDATHKFRMDKSGFGLARCLDDIVNYQRENFDALEERFCQIFTHVRKIRFDTQPAFQSRPDDPRRIPTLSESPGKRIDFELKKTGQRIPASQASDGTLLVLAYLMLLYLPKDHAPRLLLIEEPENGIHPRRLQDVLGILRELVEEQDHTQVVMTTHSPYVVDLFKPEEVTLCHKEEDGSVSVHTLSESETVREQLDVFTLGEIWTAEGDEALSQQPGKEAAL